jgi:hypothetical protein
LDLRCLGLLFAALDVNFIVILQWEWNVVKIVIWFLFGFCLFWFLGFCLVMSGSRFVSVVGFSVVVFLLDLDGFVACMVVSVFSQLDMVV